MKQMKIKIYFLLIITFFMLSITAQAQRGVRIGYIDTEYILEKIPEYQEATAQLESKVQKWKGEIETQLSVIEQKRKDLSNEKALLTNELIKEREEDISFEESEILDYQQKRFGHNGDLMIQKKQLIEPIQDQIFAAVQDIAATKKYDFVFDKSADVVMLYSANRFDMSELVIRTITRASKRKQAQSKSERKEAENEDVVPLINEEQEARQKALDDKKTDREAAAEIRKQEIIDAREAKKNEAAARRAKTLEDRENARQAKIDERNKTSEDANKEEENEDGSADEEKKENANEGEEQKTSELTAEEKRQQKIEDRAARKKELEDRKKKILEDRKKAKEERENKNTEEQETEEDGENNN